ncbi:hypothetical protein JW859_01990 [bacterium]|nr:hypothetical protein [bacterium]
MQFSADSVWLYISIFVALAYVFGAIWAINDAMTRYELGCAGMGCIWPVLILLFPPALPFYIIMRLQTSRRVPHSVVLKFDLEREEREQIPRLPSDIHKLRYLAAADKEHGTMYEPQMGLPAGSRGFPHFTDGQAEALLEQARFDEAYDYLVELHDLAVASEDVRGRDTYKHYISRIPGGLDSLRQHEVTYQDRYEGQPPPVDRSMPF